MLGHIRLHWAIFVHIKACGFFRALAPEEAKSMFDVVIRAFGNTGVSVEQGIFQSQMQVKLVNDGPVTIMIDSEDRNASRGS